MAEKGWAREDAGRGISVLAASGGHPVSFNDGRGRARCTELLVWRLVLLAVVPKSLVGPPMSALHVRVECGAAFHLAMISFLIQPGCRALRISDITAWRRGETGGDESANGRSWKKPRPSQANPCETLRGDSDHAQGEPGMDGMGRAGREHPEDAVCMHCSGACSAKMGVIGSQWAPGRYGMS